MMARMIIRESFQRNEGSGYFVFIIIIKEQILCKIFSNLSNIYDILRLLINVNCCCFQLSDSGLGKWLQHVQGG